MICPENVELVVAHKRITALEAKVERLRTVIAAQPGGEPFIDALDAADAKVERLKAIIPTKPDGADRLIWMMHPKPEPPFRLEDDMVEKGEKMECLHDRDKWIGTPDERMYCNQCESHVCETCGFLYQPSGQWRESEDASEESLCDCGPKM